jgi:hypothetical protein
MNYQSKTREELIQELPELHQTNSDLSLLYHNILNLKLKKVLTIICKNNVSFYKSYVIQVMVKRITFVY